MQSSQVDRAQVIDRFQCSGVGGYSEFWRRNKSTVEIHEMAQLLSALRKVASYVGGNVGKIVWSGMKGDDAIALDPSMVLGSYPVPADKTDRIVGHAIRQAYAKTEWSERLESLAKSRSKLPNRYEYKFGLCCKMFERVYLDCLSNRSVLGYYTELERKQRLAKAMNDASSPPTISEMLHLWWEMAADRGGEKHKRAYRDRSVRGLSKRTNLEKYYAEPIALLNTIVDRLNHECPKIHGVSERVNYRIDLYFSIWPGIFEIIKYWASNSSDPFLQNSRKSTLPQGLGEEENEKLKPVCFPEEVEQVIATKSRELTERVQEVVSNKTEVVRIRENNIVMPGRQCIQKKLLHNLKFVIKTAAQKHTTFSRGLRTGKIDRRRLYRAPTTGTIFQVAKTRFELVNDIVVIVDASGSMATPTKWEKAEEIYQTLFTAIHYYNPKARLFGYNEFKSVCRITELYLRDRFYSILPHGKTASGEALISMTQCFTRSNKKPFIIHLTDGASNWGCGVENAISVCNRNKINLLTLGMGCDENSKEMLREEYGSLVKFVDNLDSLPQLLRDLLNKSKWA